MKQRGVLLVSITLLTVYYFLFPQVSKREMILLPETIVGFDRQAFVPNGGYPVSRIQSGNRAFYLDAKGQPVYYLEAESVSVDNQWWAISNGSEVEIREPDGRLRTRIAIAALPYASHGQLFLLHDGNGSLFKVDPSNGSVLWQREFLSRVTVLEARGERSLVGLLDGRCLLIEDTGETLLTYKPGGSRIEAIYGGALSSDGTKIAIISGLDPQRFIMLVERSNGFRPVANHAAETDFRRSVLVDFIDNDTHVVYESDDYVASVEVNRYKQRRLYIPGTPVAWSIVANTGALAMLGIGSTQRVLKIVSRYEFTLFESNLPMDIRYMNVIGERIFLIGEERYGVLKMSLQ